MDTLAMSTYAYPMVQASIRVILQDIQVNPQTKLSERDPKFLESSKGFVQRVILIPHSSHTHPR